MLSRILLLCLACIYTAPLAKAQIEPIINNGYLSRQGWAGAIHPSGDFVVRADRSVIHAYDRHNHMLFQTYQSPCIATVISFSANGNYMLVQSFGEIGESCNRTVVYDFYTGKILFDQRGRYIRNYGSNNRLHLIRYRDQNSAWPDSLDAMLEIYNLDNPGKPLAQLGNSMEYDTVSLFTHPDTDKTYEVKGLFMPADILSGKAFESGHYDAAYISGMQDFVSAYGEGLIITEIVPPAGGVSLFAEYMPRAIVDTLLLVAQNGNVDVYSLPGQQKLTTVAGVSLYGLNYLQQSHKVALMPATEKTTAQMLDLKTLQAVTIPGGNHYYNDYNLFETDSTIRQVSMYEGYARALDYNIYNPVFSMGTEIAFTRDTSYRYSTGYVTSDINPAKNLVLHNNVLLVDLNTHTSALYYTDYDTTLVHPAVVKFDPANGGSMQLNEWRWNLTQASQFERVPAPLCTGSDMPETGWRPAKKGLYAGLYQYAFKGYASFNYAQISNPYTGGYNLRNVVNPGYRNPGSKYNNLLYTLSGDSLLLACDEGGYIKLPAQSEDELKKQEKWFAAYTEKNYSPQNLHALNNRFPAFIFATLDYEANGNKFGYKTSFKQTRENKYDWLYAPVHNSRTANATTPNRSLAESYFIRNLVKPSLDFDYATGKPLICINILNREEIPDPTYAGIIPENDVYFQDVTFPIFTDRLLALNYAHGTFKLQDKNGKTITQSSLYSNGEFIHLTPEGYYFASKNRLDRISVRMGKKVYPIEQFDLKYNRPDMVLQRLGCTDKAMLDSYHKAYLKRLKKMNFTEAMLGDDFHLPEITIANRAHIPAHTADSKVKLALDMADGKYKLDRVNVWINNVPVYGLNGIDLRARETNMATLDLTLDLCAGKNTIQVSVLNQAGAESYKATVVTTYAPGNKAKPDLYLVSIGDSKYADNRFDLAYAAKDATDITTAFKGNAALYANVYAYTLTDKDVTRQNIQDLKAKLQQAQRDDVVMVTVAGHGVLDSDYNYYLATYDMDFTNPGKNGLPYEELEALLDGIAPLKKTILIDACHSGEVDKDEVEQLAAAQQTKTGDVTFRTAGAGIQPKNLGLKTTSRLMDELFTDLRKGTGATVISSAGGVEYAMESGEWQNGLFTYCMLNGLQTRAADANGDGEIWLSELQRYVQKEVTRLSNGKQQPTSRVENMSMDFRVW